MKIFLDSATPAEIKAAKMLFPALSGATTNPIILARCKRADVASHIRELIDAVGEGLLFFQLTDPMEKTGGLSSKASEMGAERFAEALKSAGTRELEEAEAYISLFPKESKVRPVIKVPAGPEGCCLASRLTGKGIAVCMTAVYTVPQAILAVECGAEFVAPYVSHIERETGDSEAGIRTASEMQNALKRYGFAAEVLAASFRRREQLEGLMEQGVAAATVTASMLLELLSSEHTEKEKANFKAQYEAFYGARPLAEYIIG